MKKTLLLMLLILSLTLSGCSLVVKDPVVDMKQVVLSVNGETMDKQSMLVAYNYELQNFYQMQQFYQMYGAQAPQVTAQELLEQAKDSSVRRMVLNQKAQELKLDDLTDDEQAELTSQVDSSYQLMLDQVKAQYFPDTELEGDALQDELLHTAEDLGQTRDLIETNVKDAFLAKKLEAQSTADITVPDEDVKADFDAKVEANKTSWEADVNAYGNAVNNRSKVYYAPGGYRMIKQVLIKFLEEDQPEIDELTAAQATALSALTTAQADKEANDTALAAEGLSEDDKQALTDKVSGLDQALSQAQADLAKADEALKAATDKALAKILPKAQEVYELSKTQPFDELVKEYNDDVGQPEQGYAVRKGFASFDPAFVLPAMALENVGDVAEPSPGNYGYYIVQYAAPVEEGPIDYESVRQELHDSLLSTKKSESWESQVQAWIDASDVVAYMDRMQD